MPYSNARRFSRQIEMVRGQFAQGSGLSFAEVLPSERIVQALEAEGATWRDCVFTPAVTLWAFLGQVISADSSCRLAVARVLAWLMSVGDKACAAETGPYCKARQRLPENLFARLTRETGRALNHQSASGWLWKGRRTKIVDGTTVSMPDTAANQQAYPQAPTQKPDLGFPIARLVVVFCLACGTVLDAALGRYEGKQTGENSLLRTLEENFEAGDVLLADRSFSGYFDIAWWQKRGLDVVTHLHHCRPCDMRRGALLGPDDHIVVWLKPRQRPEWMSAATYAEMPAELYVREVRVRVEQRGFRSREVVVATTLLDDEEYSASELADLYRARWHAELDLRTLKVTLHMDVLRCKTPPMVRKEVWAHFLAYNLIRTVMAQAALRHDLLPRALSFKGTLQIMVAFAERLCESARTCLAELYNGLLQAIAAQRVGDRPNRIEPRAYKRRPKPYPLLMKPRALARKQLLGNT